MDSKGWREKGRLGGELGGGGGIRNKGERRGRRGGGMMRGKGSERGGEVRRARRGLFLRDKRRSNSPKRGPHLQKQVTLFHKLRTGMARRCQKKTTRGLHKSSNPIDAEGTTGKRPFRSGRTKRDSKGERKKTAIWFDHSMRHWGHKVKRMWTPRTRWSKGEKLIGSNKKGEH